MKIVVLSSYLPYPPDSGGRIRIWEQLSYLQRRHEVTLACFYLDETELPLVEALSHLVEHLVAIPQLLREDDESDPRPRQIARFNAPAMRDALTALTRQQRFDLAIIEQIFMAQYAPFIESPAILQEHNIESQVLKRFADVSAHNGDYRLIVDQHFCKAQSEWVKMKTYEDATWPAFPVRITVSDLDREEMLRRCPTGQVITIPNGVNCSLFSPLPPTSHANILFLGSMFYQPNLDAAFELCDVILPLVRQHVPTTRLYIVGRKPPAELLARQQPGSIEIVPDADDIIPYAACCCVSAVPLRVGGGTRIKILTSMALGLPVVSTSMGCEGLGLRAEQDLLIADEPEAFANSLLHLLLDEGQRLELARHGRVLVERYYDWRQILPQLEAVCDEVVSVRGRGQVCNEGSPA